MRLPWWCLDFLLPAERGSLYKVVNAHDMRTHLMDGDYPRPHLGIMAPCMYHGMSSLADSACITCNAFVYASNCAKGTQVLDAQHAPWRDVGVELEHDGPGRARAGLAPAPGTAV
jgi:hypothetical protein